MRRVQVVTAACAALMWTAAAGVPMAAAQGPGSGGGSAQGSTQAGSSTGATAGTSGMGDRDAQEGAGTTASTQAPSNSANDLQQFVEKAAIANMVEIELGKLATQQAQDPQVKQFAQMMVDEHTSALEQLRTVASSQGLQVASSLDSKHQKLQQKLSKLQGAEFDRAYMDAMVDAHKDAEKLLKSRAGNTGSESAANMAHSQGTTGTTGTSGTATGSDTSAAGASRPAGSASGTSATGTSGTPSSDTSPTTGTSGSTETGTPSVGTPGTTGTSGTSSSGTGAAGSPAGMTAPASADQWAAMTLPKVRAHLEQARTLEGQVKRSGKSNNGNNSGAGNTGAGSDATGSGSSQSGSGSTPPQR